MISQKPDILGNSFQSFVTILARSLFKKVKYAVLPHDKEGADFIQAAVMVRNEYSYRSFSTWPSSNCEQFCVICYTNSKRRAQLGRITSRVIDAIVLME